MRYPVDNYQITQTFNNPAGHGGLDLASGAGTPILSPVTGTVLYIGTNPSYIGGLYIVIREDAPNRWEYYTGHHRRLLVSPGQRVSEGQQIAEMDMTGTATGNHTHFQVRQFNSGALIDPVYVYNYYNPSGGGNTMNDDTARQVAYHFLGRNGFDGAENALAVGAPYLIGRALTNQEFQNIFLGEESRQWRDHKLPSVFGERNELRSINANQAEQIARLKTDVTTANTQRDQAIAEKTALQIELDKTKQENADLKTQNVNLQTQLDTANKRIAELEADAGHDVTINFNFFGNICWGLIQSLGIKRKGV